VNASTGRPKPSSPFAEVLAAAVSAPPPPLPSKLTHRTLSDAIANALYVVSAHELADECVRLGLDPMEPDEAPPFSGKHRYVMRRLRTLPLGELLALARTVDAEYEHAPLTHLLALGSVRGVDGDLKNLIFAAVGRKPRIVLRDAVSNIIEITEGADRVLVYDRPLGETGLSWRALVRWHAGNERITGTEELRAGRALYSRLLASMEGNGAEQLLFAEYARLYASHGFDLPALVPQVYLHYDPYTRRAGGTLHRQRMDFLLLLPGRRRVVLEIDGRQHYADDAGQADPGRYAEMVAEDRRLRLAGYEVYRFGGKELVDRTAAKDMLRTFFLDLLELDGLADPDAVST